MKKLMIAAVLGGAALCAPAALAQVDTPEQIVASFAIPDLNGLLDELGYEHEAGTLPSGAAVIRVTAPDGLAFYLQPRACDADRCAGLSITAAFRGPAPFDPAMITAYNLRYVFMKGVLLPDGGALLGRYIIADYGIPRGNIAVNIAAFVNMAGEFGQSGEPGGQPNTGGAVEAGLSSGVSAFTGRPLTVPGTGVHGDPFAGFDEIDAGMVNRLSKKELSEDELLEDEEAVTAE